MGRLVGAVEDPASKNYVTTYSYDLLDDLTGVNEAGLIRSFQDNWLRQLVSATNPESGSTCFGPMTAGACVENYDGNGNLMQKTDGRAVLTTYAYDALNRLSTKTYSDGTPAVALSYDLPVVCPGNFMSYGKGRLSQVSTAATAAALPTVQSMTYDALGRVCSSAETVGTPPAYVFGYGYDFASGLISQTYPSGRVVTTGFDKQERPNSLWAGSTTYIGSVTYGSNDSLTQLKFGPATTPVATQNIALDPVRQQPTTLSVLTAAGPQVTLGYRYCPGAATSCSSNNGNLQSASIVSAEGLNVSPSYGYDKLNRLTGVTESASSVVKWNQAYTYDQWGNRAVTGNYIPNPYATPSALAQYSNSQWGGPGVSYDQAGNQLSLPARTFTYDAENRLNASTQLSAGTIQYLYDGTGKRVKRIVGTTATVFVYDAKGDLAAEYSNAGATNGGVQYLIGDPLGSTRAIINGSSGQVMQRLDYLPFGEEINTGTSGRSSIYPSGIYPSAPDISSMKFTGKERDAETGLDYFGARYLSSAQGRWTSVDPAMESEDVADPQTWNRYSYVFNRPLTLTDPDGRCPNCVTAGGGALLGFGLGFGGSVVTQALSGQKINYRDAFAAGAGGAVSGALAGFTLGGSLIAEASIGAGTVLATGIVSNVAGGVVTRTLDSEEAHTAPFAFEEVTADAVTGAAGVLVGQGVGKAYRYIRPAPRFIPDSPGRRSVRLQNYQRATAAYEQQVKNRDAFAGSLTTNFFSQLFFGTAEVTSSRRSKN